MSFDLEVIKQIEKRLGLKLMPLELNAVMNWRNRNCYAIDENEKVIGLNLSQNEICDISFLSGLANLTLLDLSKNKIIDISFLKSLRNLIQLNLHGNQISDISALEGLILLNFLDLRENKIRIIPPNIFDLKLEIIWDYDYAERGILIKDNYFDSPPPEIRNKGKDAIVEYLISLKNDSKVNINEVKVILVGEVGSGKTSLVKQIFSEEFNSEEISTQSIVIRDWKSLDSLSPTSTLPEVIIHFWDFGGQEIMHSTHQFFLSKRSVYILVLDGRREEKAEYWLKLIENYGGDSPVLVVLNKIDRNPDFEVNRKLLKEKYKYIEAFFRISCANGTGIQEFSSNLINVATRIEIFGTTWPRNWFKVKTKLENMKKSFISYDEYNSICMSEGIHDESSQRTLVNLLSDLGAIIHFDDFKLLDMHVLEPNWITDAVYRIINSKLLAERKGVLDLDDLGIILENNRNNYHYYPRDKHRYIIELMKKFELCFDIDDHTILIPDLLEVSQPELPFDGSTYINSLKFIYDYNGFLPRSVISQFIVKMHNDICLSWRTGVYLENEAFGSTALVKAEEDTNNISIWVQGDDKYIRDYLAVIRYKFIEINRKFQKLKVEELVPCNCSECNDKLNPYYHRYSFLIRCQNKKVKKARCHESIEDLLIDSLLSGINPTSPVNVDNWDVFLSYSSDDIKIIKRIAFRLRESRISYWLDEEQIKPGDVIIDSIENGINKSKYVMPCFSRNQVESGWCRFEYNSVLHGILSGKTKYKILPLIIDDLKDEEMPLFFANIKYVKLYNNAEFENLLKFLKTKR